MAKARARDVYMNFFSLDVMALADPRDINSVGHNTAAGVATNFAWRIHVIEWYPFVAFAATGELTLAISTRKNLAAMPTLSDKGVLGLLRLSHDESAAGVASVIMPKVVTYLPPILIASPNLSLYCQTTTDDAGQDLVPHEARIGFTMVELDSAAFTELYQTWNFSD